MVARSVEELIIEANLRGDATLKIRDLERSVSRFGTRGEKSLRNVDKASRGVSDAFALVGGSATGMIAGLVAAAGGLALVQAGFRGVVEQSRAMVDVSAAAEASASRFVNEFGSDSSGAIASLSEFGDATGRATSELADYAGRFRGILGTVGLAADQASALSVSLTERAVDLGSRFDEDLGDASAALLSGLTGETEPLKRFGVLLNESAVKARAYALGLGDVTGALTEQEKVQARASLIIEQSNRVQGDAIDTADEFGNQMRRLGAQVTELRTEFGLEIQKAISDTIDELGGADATTELLTVSLGLAKEAAIGLIEAGGGLAKFGLSVVDHFGGARDVVDDFGRAIDRVSFSIKEALIDAERLSLKATRFIAGTGFGGATSRRLGELDEESGRNALELFRAEMERQSGTANFQELVADLIEAFENSVNPGQTTVVGTSDLPGINVSGGGKDATTFLEGMEAELRTQSDHLGDLVNLGTRAGAQLASGFQGAVSDYIVALGEGTDSLEAFGDAMLNVVSRTFADIASSILTSAISEQIASSIKESADRDAAVSALALSVALDIARDAAIASTVVGGGATGGYISGFPGGGYVDPRDTRLARVSPGEFILDPQDVRRLGGPSNLENFRQGGRLRSPGAGGGVSVSAPIVVHFHGTGSDRKSRQDVERTIVRAVREGIHSSPALRRDIREAAR